MCIREKSRSMVEPRLKINATRLPLNIWNVYTWNRTKRENHHNQTATRRNTTNNNEQLKRRKTKQKYYYRREKWYKREYEERKEAWTRKQTNDEFVASLCLPAARTTAWNSGSSCGCWACRARRAARAPVCSPPWRWPSPGATLGLARHPPTRATASTCECPRNFPFFRHFDSACAIRLVIHPTTLTTSTELLSILRIELYENLEDLSFFLSVSLSRFAFLKQLPRMRRK